MRNDAMQRRAGFQVRTRSTASHFLGDRSRTRWNASLPLIFCVAVLVACLPASGRAQVNSGSDGSDGAFNPTTGTNINMADHPTGIYQYTSVNIPRNVYVTFIPNAPLAAAAASKRLQTSAGKCGQVSQPLGIVQHTQLPQCYSLRSVIQSPREPAMPEALGLFAGKTRNHRPKLRRSLRGVNSASLSQRWTAVRQRGSQPAPRKRL